MNESELNFLRHLKLALDEVSSMALRGARTYCQYCHLFGNGLEACTGENCFIYDLREVVNKMEVS